MIGRSPGQITVPFKPKRKRECARLIHETDFGKEDSVVVPIKGNVALTCPRTIDRGSRGLRGSRFRSNHRRPSHLSHQKKALARDHSCKGCRYGRKFERGNSQSYRFGPRHTMREHPEYRWEQKSSYWKARMEDQSQRIGQTGLLT